MKQQVPADPAPAIGDLVDAVLASSRALVALSARSIADNSDVTLPQYRMLVVLADGRTNLTGLAGALDVIPSTAMRMVDRLVAAGLVQRSVPEADRRITQLELTTAGRETVKKVTRKRRRDLQRVIERIPEDQRPGLVAAMAAFADAVEQAWPSRTDIDS